MLVLWKASQSSDLELFLAFPKSMLTLKKKKIWDLDLAQWLMTAVLGPESWNK